MGRKKSITVEAKQIYQKEVNRNRIQGEIPRTPPELVTVVDNEQTLPLLAEGGEIAPTEQFVTDVKLETKLVVKIQDKENMFDM